MLDVCLLGTGGMMPLPYRWLTALMMRYNGGTILIDCGEGTQIAIREKGWSVKPIEMICFTHFHGDHISGLPGLLLTMGNAERTEPLTLIGPRGLERVVRSLCVIAPELPFPLKFVELNEPSVAFEEEGFTLRAFRVNHNIVCYGYSIEIKRKGKFDVERAKKLPIPCQKWKELQNGDDVEFDGISYSPDMVMGEARKGIKLAYCTDTRPTDSIVENAMNSDLFICEGMYGEKEKDEKAVQYKHMTFSEAATLAKRAQVGELWLTHYSPSLNRPEEFIEETRKIFKNTKPGKDCMSVTLQFSEE